MQKSLNKPSAFLHATYMLKCAPCLVCASLAQVLSTPCSNRRGAEQAWLQSCQGWGCSQCPPFWSAVLHTARAESFLLLTSEPLVFPTWQRAIIGNETSHVNWLAVNGEVPHAAHKLPVVHWEIFWQVWDAAEQQRASQVQRSERTKKWSLFPACCFDSYLTVSIST